MYNYNCEYIIGKDEIDIINILSKNKNVVSIYYNIDNSSWEHDMNEPPHINHELILLLKDKDNNYHTQALMKRKFSNEFTNLSEEYISLLPYGYSGYMETIDYPLKKICRNNNIYTKEEVVMMRNCINLPEELVDIVLSYLIKDVYQDESDISLIKYNDLGNNIYISDYYRIFEERVVLIIKNK